MCTRLWTLPVRKMLHFSVTQRLGRCRACSPRRIPNGRARSYWWAPTRQKVQFDDARRTGSIEGEGEDLATRTTGEGRAAFVVEAAGDATVLVLSIHHRLNGGLAQYSRGAVVDAVTGQLSLLSGDYVARAARGEALAGETEISGTQLALAAFWSPCKRFFF